jgi:hypothetical protein
MQLRGPQVSPSAQGVGIRLQRPSASQVALVATRFTHRLPQSAPGGRTCLQVPTDPSTSQRKQPLAHLALQHTP